MPMDSKVSLYSVVDVASSFHDIDWSRSSGVVNLVIARNRGYLRDTAP